MQIENKEIKMKLLEELMKEMDNNTAKKLKKPEEVEVTKIESESIPVEELPDTLSEKIEEDLDGFDDEMEEYDEKELEEDFEEALEMDEDFEEEYDEYDEDFEEDEEDEEDSHSGSDLLKRLKALRKQK